MTDCDTTVTCPNGKCQQTGVCVDRLPRVESPPLAPHADTPGKILDAALARVATPRTIVAFTGLAGSGKSTAAMHLVSARGFHRVRFAGPLKAMVAALGLTEAEIEGVRKEVPCELLCGRTPRYAMQTIGTEWGRNIIGQDLWIRAWRAAVDRLPPGAPVVVDDVRFPNEAEAVRAAGGIIVRIERPGAGTGAAGHSSEGQPIKAHCGIRNTGSVADMLETVDMLFA